MGETPAHKQDWRNSSSNFNKNLQFLKPQGVRKRGRPDNSVVLGGLLLLRISLTPLSLFLQTWAFKDLRGPPRLGHPPWDPGVGPSCKTV